MNNVWLVAIFLSPYVAILSLVIGYMMYMSKVLGSRKLIQFTDSEKAGLIRQLRGL
jgi:hypothetical protein